MNGLGLYITALFLRRLFGNNEYRLRRDMDRFVRQDTHRCDAAPLSPQRPRAPGRRCALVCQRQRTSGTLCTRSSFGQVRNGAWIVSCTAKNLPVRHQWGDDKQHNINTFISSNLPQSQRGGCAFFLGSVNIWEWLSAFQLPCHVQQENGC